MNELVFLLLVAATVGLAVLVICLAWQPEGESFSERNHRLDAEARAATRPTTSSRKSGRTRADR